MIAEDDRVRRAPFEIRDLPRGDEIDLGAKRAVETVFPTLERAQHGQVFGLELVVAGFKNVGQLTAMDKDGLLPRPHNELCAVLDFVLIAGKSPDQCAIGVVDPFNDVDEFVPELVKKSHRPISRLGRTRACCRCRPEDRFGLTMPAGTLHR